MKGDKTMDNNFEETNMEILFTCIDHDYYYYYVDEDENEYKYFE
jgi:hypothetical protein